MEEIFVRKFFRQRTLPITFLRTPSRQFLLVSTLLLSAATVNTFSTPRESSHVDLKAAYTAALKNTETVGLQETVVKQTEERLSQTTGRMMPNIALLASYLHQAPSNSPGGGVSAFTRSDQYNARVNLTQPLFRGLGDFAERSANDALREAEQARIQVAKLLLYSSVAQAFYQVLGAQADLDNLQVLTELTEKRVVELKERVKIGRSRKGELLAAEAQVATLLAQIESGRLALDRAKETFRFSTGLGENTQLIEKSEAVPEISLDIDSFLPLVEKRPDLSASKARVVAADERVTVAHSGHFPSVDFNANYYLTRTGVLADSKWDLGVQLRVPIFQGGEIQAQVREASESKKQRELELSQTRREAIREVRTLYQELSSQIAQHRTLKKALTIAESNYEVQKRDYRYGLTTSLEVLQALNAFQETKRLLDRTRFQAMAAYASLRAATGTIE